MNFDLEDENGGNVISIEVAREYYSAKTCEHRKVTVDQKLTYIKCRDCKQNINPIWWLTQLIGKWSHFKRLHARYTAAAKLYEEKQRTRCEHCRRITRVNPPEKFESNLRKMSGAEG